MNDKKCVLKIEYRFFSLSVLHSFFLEYLQHPLYDISTNKNDTHTQTLMTKTVKLKNKNLLGTNFMLDTLRCFAIFCVKRIWKQKERNEIEVSVQMSYVCIEYYTKVPVAATTDIAHQPNVLYIL